MAAVIKPGASDTGPTWRRRMREAFREAKRAKLNERDMWTMLMHVVEDEFSQRDERERKLAATLERYRIFWCDAWTCSKCGEKTAQEPLWEPET